ncbi:MAG: hypothetical protein C0622_14210 [Desulfuromonas sp.]|nr:MAG: hypothetical protein C0622_14210 [Desulfuromonas sp.]
MSNEFKIPFNEAWRRVVKITGWENYTQLADFLKIKPSSVSGAKKRSLFPLEWLYRIAIEYRTQLEWLASGSGGALFGETDDAHSFSNNKKNNISIAEGVTEKSEEYKIISEFVLVPRYNVQASMGGGADVHSEQVVDHLAFKRTWLKEMDLQAEHLALITAKGDSMYPTIKDGCLMLIDTRKDQSIRDGIYVLRWDGALLAKRLQRLLDGAILVKSDNPIYQEIKAEKDQVELLDIIGRVVWSGGKI